MPVRCRSALRRGAHPSRPVVLAGSLFCLSFRHGGLQPSSGPPPRRRAVPAGKLPRPFCGTPTARRSGWSRRCLPPGSGAVHFSTVLPLAAGKVHTALLHHPVEGRKSCHPTWGDLDLVRRDGCAVHIQTVAGEPCLDVLCTLNFVHRRRDRNGAVADEPAPAEHCPPPVRSTWHQTQFFFRLVLLSVTTNISPCLPQPVYCSENNLFSTVGV